MKLLGRKFSSHGYVLIYHPKHQNAMAGYVYEHRFVIEQKIGRILESFEDVHHINGIKHDNRLINLALLTHKEHLRQETKLRHDNGWKPYLKNLHCSKCGRLIAKGKPHSCPPKLQSNAQCTLCKKFYRTKPVYLRNKRKNLFCSFAHYLKWRWNYDSPTK